MELIPRAIENYVAEHAAPVSPVLAEIEHFSRTATEHPSMLTGRNEGKFLQILVMSSGAKRIVDIGTFTGYSALAMAEVLPDDGTVITLEKNPDYASIAHQYFDRSPHGRKITIVPGEALDALHAMSDGSADLIFIDADKHDYPACYTETMRLVRPGGLIVADNALWYGRVLDPQDEETQAIVQFNDLVRSDTRTDHVLLTIRDGIYLIRKK